MRGKKSKAILAVDSSGQPLKIALRAPSGRSFSASCGGIKQEEYLFPILGRLLGKAGIGLKDIAKIFVFTGPGRFTGLRIGITFALVMNKLSGAKICSATVFDALAFEAANSADFARWSSARPDGVVACVTHAFRQEYFCQIFKKNQKGVLTASGSPKWLELAALREYLDSLRAPVYCAGWAEARKELRAVLGAGFSYSATRSVSAETLLSLCETAKPGPVRPLYLKPARFELAR